MNRCVYLPVVGVVDGKLEIVFDIQVADGKLSDQSKLWMGSLYDLLGRVMIPRGDKFLLDRWLAYRPIPEIIGPPSNDPELIGLPELLFSYKNWNSLLR